MVRDNLQLLYDELFGVDDEDQDTAACYKQSGYHAPSGGCVPSNRLSSSPVIEQRLVQAAHTAGPPGLALFKQWVSQLRQAELLQAIDAEGWLSAAANQAMCFGKLPEWTRWLIDAMPLKGWPQQIRNRQPLFDQMIVNSYKPGEGIVSHVDLLKFDDGIAVFSLGASATMTFTKAEEECNAQHPHDAACTQLLQQHQAGSGNRNQLPASERSAASQSLHCDVYLEPGDLLLLHSEARYTWKHGIAECTAHRAEDASNRVSITLRKML